MYPRASLAADAQRLESAVRKIFEIGILPTLSPDERRQLGDISFQFPMPVAGDDLLNFYAYRNEGGQGIAVMPILSLKALEDLATAYAWIQVQGLRHSTIDLYYAMLEHRAASHFPGGRHPDVLTAIGMPKGALDNKAVDRLSLSLRNEAFAFILVHELGHILFRHKGYDQITKAEARADEVQADRFALDVLARSATPPLGAVFYFQAQIYRFEHRGSFATAEEWDDYLSKVATHPMSADRLRAMADHIAGPLARMRGHESLLWVGIGEQLRRVADILQDPDLQRCIVRVAREAPLTALKPSATDASQLLMDICRRR